MNKRKRKRRRTQSRIYIAAAILAISIAAFLLVRNALIESRGYVAIGGEYLIIPLGFLLAYAVCAHLFSVKEEKASKHPPKSS